MTVRALFGKNETKHCHFTPPCSPDLVRCIFFLFPKVEVALKGKKIIFLLMQHHHNLSKVAGLTVAQWHRAHCMKSHCEYFEGTAFVKM
jgi:hypothetical protein